MGLKLHISLIISTIMILAALHCTDTAERGRSESFHASGFKILDSDDTRTVLKDSLNRTMTVVHGKSKKSEKEFFHSPAGKVISISSPSVPLIVALDETDSLKGVRLPAASWYLKEIKKRMNSGKIKLIGNGSHGYMNFEAIVALNPDLVFTNTEIENRWEVFLSERGIKTVAVLTHLERSLMGQFEWIRFISCFYGREKKASDLFTIKKDLYSKISSEVRSSPSKTKTLWCNIVQHRVSVPGGDSFIANAIADAGGDYVLKNFTSDLRGGYIPLDMELFYETGRSADVMIISATKSAIGNIDSLIRINPFIQNFISIKNKRVWCYRPCFWQSIHRPDEILKDITAMLHPELHQDHRLTFFEKL